MVLPFILLLWLRLAFVELQTAPFTCKSGALSTTACKTRLFVSKYCEDKQLQCENGKFCCPKIDEKKQTTFTVDKTVSESTKPAATRKTSQTIKKSTKRPSTVSRKPYPNLNNCSNCTAFNRHKCLAHIYYKLSSQSITEVPECQACQNCCVDTSTRRCTMWNQHGFCSGTFYTPIVKKIFCPKTCGFC